MKFHDRDWMPWRVLRQDEIVGIGSETLDLEKGKLELSMHNIIVACLFHYNSGAPYVLQEGSVHTLAMSEHHKNNNVLASRPTVIYDAKRPEDVQKLLLKHNR